MQKMLVIAGIIAGVGFVSAGFYVAIDSASLYSAKEKASALLKEGNYAAAVAGLGDIVARSPQDEEIVSSFEEAKKFLIAEKDFERARAAAISGDSFLAYALLSASTAVQDEKFAYFEEAKRILDEATTLILANENIAAARIIELKKQAAQEAEYRLAAEAQKTKTEENLTAITTAKQNTESELQNTKNQLNQKNEELAAQQQKIEQETTRANAIAAQIETERNQKFITDLKNYVGMIVNAEDKLRIGAAELSSGNDITTLFYVGQAKVILEEAKKVGDLRDISVSSEYKQAADTALRAILSFEGAVSKLKSATAFIDNQNSDFYANFINEYQAAFDAGIALRQEVEKFLSGK